MFTEKQKQLRCMIMKNHNHDELPEALDYDVISRFYTQLCEWGGHAKCSDIRLMAAGKEEPLDEQMKSWSTVINWHNHWIQKDK
ncbi:hypothetical protein [Pantoea vagans]